jgi:hypothetical protein
MPTATVVRYTFAETNPRILEVVIVEHKSFDFSVDSCETQIELSATTHCLNIDASDDAININGENYAYSIS